MRRSFRALPLLPVALCLLGVAGFCALGVWQVERRAWKLDLLEQIHTRIHAPAVDAPGPSRWADVKRGAWTYRPVRVRGEYQNGRETLVWAVTRLGGGFWVLTPLRTEAGYVVLVNRGFVPTDRSAPADRAAGRITGTTVVTGLVRLSEPKGAFLRANVPGEGRWYSRDVEAIGASLALSPLAPFFLDADATPVPGGLPVGGLTVTDPPNNHLVYAITWFTLALLCAGAAVIVVRRSPHRVDAGVLH